MAVRHPLAAKVAFSDQAMSWFQEKEAMWLWDAIATDLAYAEELVGPQQDPEFQSIHFWKLEADPENEGGAKLVVRLDRDDPVLFEQRFSFVDLDEEDYPVFYMSYTQIGGEPMWHCFLPEEY